MNILIVHEVDWLKKVTYEIHHLSELFSLMGHNVFAIDLREPDAKNLVKGLQGEIIENYNRIYENASVTIIRPPNVSIKGLNRLVTYLTSYTQIKSVLQKYEINVVLLYSVVTSAKQTIRACKELNIPVVHRTFDIIHDLVREKYLREFIIKIEQQVYSNIDKVIVNTPFMKDWAVHMGTPNDHVRIIPQGVDSNIMRPLSWQSQLADELGVKSDDKIIFYLGSIEEFSGLEVIIENFDQIKKSIPKLKLLIVGGGSYLIKLQKLATQFNVKSDVIFTGYKPYKTIPKYCSLVTLCINTFRINAMTDKLSPVKIFDLQACGKPILSTPLKGLKVDFPEDTSGVIYCNLEDFINTIPKLLQDEQNLKNIGMRGKEFVEKNFTWKKVAEDMLNELLSAQSSRRDID